MHAAPDLAARAAALATRLGLELPAYERLGEALVHSSYLNEDPRYRGPSNERLEFLGDAVIGLVVGDWLFLRFPEIPEGQLTTLRAALVRRETLCDAAARLDLGDALLMGRGEAAAGSRMRPAVLSAAFEAVVGALWLDCGYDVAREWILRWLEPELQAVAVSGVIEADPKTRLQQETQARQLGAPVYQVTAASGPDHAREFTIQVLVAGEVRGEGHGASKRAAEMEAARQALAPFLGDGNRVP